MRSWSARWALTAVAFASGFTARARAACGDGVLESGEACDDANVSSGDGCAASCLPEAGYVCSGAPSTCCFVEAARSYALLGNATLDEDTGEITLTSDSIWQHGTAWYRQPIDFANPFRISLWLHLGSHDAAPAQNANDTGADGAALLFQRDPRGVAALGEFSGAAGEDGGELGAKGIAPLLGVEFDTYDNGATFGDGTTGDEDHLSVFHGRTQPATNQLVAATCMNAGTTCENYEDGRYHRYSVEWSGEQERRFTVYVDGVLRIDRVLDLVREYFASDPRGIIFGLSANTGGLHNLHRFCPMAPGGFTVPRDADGDGIDDALDQDDDGDGLSDREETGNAFGASDPGADSDLDGVADHRDVDHWAQALARAADCLDELAPIGACDALPTQVDFDRDGVPDHLDTDSDGDGALDASDPARLDRCIPVHTRESCSALDAGVSADASVEASTPDACVNGCSPSGDSDGDLVPDTRDVAPSDPCVPNANVVACARGDADGDGLSNGFECPDRSACRDTDRDGVADYADADSDGDGKGDRQECANAAACADADGDGTPDLLAPMTHVDSGGCALHGRAPGSPLWLVLAALWFSARTGWSGRSARARACGARRSLLCSRSTPDRPRASPRSS